MKLNLIKFFQLVANESYVVIKPSELLPEYKIGSDIDIFCLHSSRFIEKVSTFLASYVCENSSVKVKDELDKAHIDYIVDGKIHFRFDIYKSLPRYQNITLKPAFFSSVVESANEVILSVSSEEALVKVPSIVDDFIIRYVEYHEYYAQRPDKIKHIHYIQQKLSKNDSDVARALDKLHYYTSFPQSEYRAKAYKERFLEKIAYYRSLLLKVRHLYINVGFKSVMIRIFKKLGFK